MVDFWHRLIAGISGILDNCATFFNVIDLLSGFDLTGKHFSLLTICES